MLVDTHASRVLACNHSRREGCMNGKEMPRGRGACVYVYGFTSRHGIHRRLFGCLRILLLATTRHK